MSDQGESGPSGRQVKWIFATFITFHFTDTMSLPGLEKDMEEQHMNDNISDRTKLNSAEKFWAKHQKLLEENEYMLGRRDRPDWVPLG